MIPPTTNKHIPRIPYYFHPISTGADPATASCRVERCHLRYFHKDTNKYNGITQTTTEEDNHLIQIHLFNRLQEHTLPQAFIRWPRPSGVTIRARMSNANLFHTAIFWFRMRYDCLLSSVKAEAKSFVFVKCARRPHLS